MINNLDGNAFTELPFFDNEFIKTNKIKSFEGQYSKKKDGDIVRSTSDFYKYEFDSLGNLVKTIHVKTDAGKKDTSYNFYIYNDRNLIITHKKSEGGGITSTYYQYDSINRIIGYNQSREILDTKGDVLQSISINKESIKYFPFDKGPRKVTYNNYGLPYMDEYTIWNEDGYKLEEIQKLRMASAEYKKKFFYNEKGLLASIRVHYNDSEKPVEETTFNYDHFGNLIEKKQFKEGIFIGELQIIYDNKTQLLGSTIERIEGTNMMSILRFNDIKFFK